MSKVKRCPGCHKVCAEKGKEDNPLAWKRVASTSTTHQVIEHCPECRNPMAKQVSSSMAIASS